MTGPMEMDELQLLKERATQMGIPYHPSIGASSLKERITAKMMGEPVHVPKAKSTAESIPQRNSRLRREASRLSRIRVTCMNPNKKEWPGEFISVSNNAIGTIKKFIHFDAEEGYHVPIVLLDVLRERKFQQFYTVKQNGQAIKKSRLAREFAIEILDPLTPTELRALADRQQMARNEG